MMDANEEYVRSAWETVTVVANPNSKPYWIHSRTTYLGEGPFTSEDEMWAAAAEFTRQREEEIRQVREEIALIDKCVIGIESGDFLSVQDLIEDVRFIRILARLESALADLTRGMTVRP